MNEIIKVESATLEHNIKVINKLKRKVVRETMYCYPQGKKG
jgi:hypothetical protein